MPDERPRRDLRLRPPNPLRSESDAFGFLIWFVCVVAVIVLIVLLIRTI